MTDYANREQRYVNDSEWEKRIDLAIELTCLRGDIKSVKSNPIATIALLGALDS